MIFKVHEVHEITGVILRLLIWKDKRKNALLPTDFSTL